MGYAYASSSCYTLPPTTTPTFQRTHIHHHNLNQIYTGHRTMSVSVAFVCLGNICRSPMAEAIFKHQVKQQDVEDLFDDIDSFGTGAYHTGAPPDSRSARECRKNGVAVNHKAQRIRKEHFNQFDYLLAMDESNLEDLQYMAPKGCRAKVYLFGDFRTDKSYQKIVDDPYYGGAKGFEINFKQITHFSANLIGHIKNEHQS